MSDKIKLIKPCLKLESQFMDMVQDFVIAGEELNHLEFQFSLENFPTYVRNCKKWEAGIDLPDGWVPTSTFWLIRQNNIMIGTSSLRHKLNDKLRVFGGHIGYKISPAQRQKGYGTTILKLTLVEARRLGLKKVLVTCDNDNITSAKIIEKNSGILKDKCERSEPGKLSRRYWIDLK